MSFKYIEKNCNPKFYGLITTKTNMIVKEKTATNKRKAALAYIPDSEDFKTKIEKNEILPDDDLSSHKSNALTTYIMAFNVSFGDTNNF